ncbi:MAG: transcriptional repressor [Planctomycetota bacterium]|nr:MAG: transcriptional repressor [Planctomycetota bacterium]
MNVTRNHAETPRLPPVQVKISPTEKFREFLEAKGQRLTHERRIVVEEVYSSHEHFDSEQLINRLANRKDSNRVSRSTVYRTLSLLEEAGMLRKVARQNDRDVYEHDYGYPRHDHMICEKCGDLIEFPNDQIAELLERITREYGFRRTGHRLEVYGICRSCSRPPKSRIRKLDMI